MVYTDHATPSHCHVTAFTLTQRILLDCWHLQKKLRKSEKLPSKGRGPNLIFSFSSVGTINLINQPTSQGKESRPVTPQFTCESSLRSLQFLTVSRNTRSYRFACLVVAMQVPGGNIIIVPAPQPASVKPKGTKSGATVSLLTGKWNCKTLDTHLDIVFTSAQ